MKYRSAALTGMISLALAVSAAGSPQHGAQALTEAHARDDGQGPRAAWLQQDPADSLYRAARGALNRREYRDAASAFRQLRERYPRSGYVASAHYWEAFARNRMGTNPERRQALQLLERMIENYPDDDAIPEARELAAQIRGQLARGGDAEAAEEVVTQAGNEEEVRFAALNALLHMDSDRAMPLLRRIMERRDAGSQELRRRAVFLIAQQDTDEAADLLLDAAQDDPDAEVRSQAVFWLGQVDDDRAVEALEHILDTSDDSEVQQNAVFALSQLERARAWEIVRRLAENENAAPEARHAAVFWLGQSSENTEFLYQLYDRLRDAELKERVIFGIAQHETASSQQLLIQLAMRADEPLDLRKNALFWAGQNDDLPITRLAELYDTVQDAELKEQLIFVYAQHDSREAVDKLMDIARSDEDPEMRRKAIFWLSQSDDPRVADFLMEIIGR